MEDKIGQVLGVTGTQTRTGKTKYEVAFSDGQKYTTFHPDLATKAQNLVGQQVSVRTDTEINGQYTNLYLRDISPQGQLAPLAMPVPAGTPVAAPIPIAPASSNGRSPEVEQRIVRQNVLGTAFNFVGNLFSGAGPENYAEAFNLSIDLAKQLYTLAYYGPSAESIAEAVNGQASAPLVAVGAPEEPPAAPTPSW